MKTISLKTIATNSPLTSEAASHTHRPNFSPPIPVSHPPPGYTSAMHRIYLTILLLLPLVGCASYEYDLLRPEELAGRASSKEALVRTIGPIEYRMVTVENRLVIKMFNTSDQPIKLLAPESTIVDPDGQSRPVKASAIQPKSFARLVLPPVRPEYRATSSGAHYGPGVRRSDFGYTDTDLTETYRLVDGGENYWNWSGESEARLVLVYEPTDPQSPQRFTHRLTLKRVKLSE